MKMSVMNMTSILKLTSQTVAGIAAAAMIVGCSPESPKATTPQVGKVEKVRNSDSHSTFNQQVDILFVVDDSGSMAEHQGNLSSNVKLFIAEVQKTKLLDYHIGVVTTSMDNAQPYDPASRWNTGCDYVNPGGGWGGGAGRACGDGKLVRYKTKIPYVDRSTPNGLSVLEQNLIVGTEGSSDEMVLDPVYAALSSPLVTTLNDGFLRKDASLAVIMMSDAEDHSSAMTPQTLYDFLLKLKQGHADKILTYAALVPSSLSNPTCTRDEYGVLPLKTEQFLKLSSGTEFNICDPDYGTKLASIAKDVVAKVGKIMYLSRPPVVDTITVVYGSQVIPNNADFGWTYDPSRNALIFGDKLVYSQQPNGTQLEVDFTVGSY